MELGEQQIPLLWKDFLEEVGDIWTPIWSQVLYIPQYIYILGASVYFSVSSEIYITYYIIYIYSVYPQYIPLNPWYLRLLFCPTLLKRSSQFEVGIMGAIVFLRAPCLLLILGLWSLVTLVWVSPSVISYDFQGGTPWGDHPSTLLALLYHRNF